ncbi:uncharacterized protein LOC143228640 isoform X2 [Tachypleus tridentatus]|uniref:uncharacterized protein LOC143228640 isoform X2 n=1 Tax=Tachypleus tridentatus TaxID=6853 RepID=UPI003FD4BA49
MILVAGNFLNAGGYAGRAAGFKMRSLLKLTDIRANKPGMNLIHYVAMQVEKKDPTLVKFSEELPSLEEATNLFIFRVSIDNMKVEVTNLRDKVTIVSTQVMNADSQIQEQMEPFLKIAEEHLTDVLNDIDFLEIVREDLADFLCEDRTTFKLEECFKVFQKFCHKFKTAIEENEHRCLQEKKAEARCRQQKEQIAAKRQSSGATDQCCGSTFGSESDNHIMFQDIQNNVSQNEFGQQFKVEKTKLDHSSEVKSQSNSLSAEEKYKSSPRVIQHRIGSITSIINGQSNVNNGELFNVTPTGSLRRRRNYLSSEDQNDELIDYLKHTSDLQDKNCKFVRNVDGGSLDRSLLRIPGRRRRRNLLAVDFNERERSTSLISQTMERTMDVSEDITEVKPKQWTRKTEDWLQVNEKEEKNVMKLDDQMLFESDKQQKQEERELDTLFYDLRTTDEGSRSSSLGTLREAKTDSEIYTRKLKNAMPNTDTERVMETVEGVQVKNKSRWRKNNMKVAYSCESVDDDHHRCHNQKSMNSLNGFKSSLSKDNSWDNDTLTLYVRKSSADSKLSKSIITSSHSNLDATMDSKLEISTQPNTSTVFDRNKEINSSNITKKDSEAVKCGSATEWSSEIQNLAPNGQTQQKVANGEAVSLPKPYIQYNITSSKQFIKPSSFTNLEFGNEKSLTSPNVIPPVSKIPVPPQKTRLYKSMMESFIRSTPFEGVKSVEDFEIIYNSKHYLTVQEGSLFKKQASADVKSTVGKQAKAAQRSQFLESNHEQTVENRGSLPQDELDGLKGEGSFDRFSLIRKTTRRTRPNQEKNGNEKVKQSTRCYDPGKGLQLVTSQCNDKVKQSTRCYDPGKGLQLVTSQCNDKVKQSTRCYDPGKGLQLVTSQCNEKVKQSTRCYDSGKGLQLVTSQCNEKVKQSTRCYDPGKGLQLVTSQCNDKVKQSTRCYDSSKGLQLVTSQCNEKVKQSTRCYDSGKGLQLVTSQCNEKVKQSTRCYDSGKGLQLVTSQCNDKVKQSTRCYDSGKGLQLVTSQCNDKVKQSTRCYDSGKGLQLVTSQCNDKVKQSTRCYDSGKGLQLVTSQCNDKVKQSTRCYDSGKGLQLVTSQCNDKVKQSTRCYDPGKGLQLVTSQCNEKDFIKREMKDTGVARLEIQQLNHFSNLKPKPCNIEELDNKSRENNYRTPIKDEPASLDSKRKSISLRARLAKRWSSLTENFKKNPETGEQHSLPGDMLSGLTYSLSEETSTGRPNNINPNSPFHQNTKSFLVIPSENLDNKNQVDVHPHSNVIEIQTSVNKSADNALQSKTEYLLSDEKCSSEQSFNEKPLLAKVSFYSKRDHSALNSSQMFKKKNLEEHDHDEGFEETQSLMSETLSQDTSSPDTDSPRNLRQIVPHGLLEKPRNTCTQLEYKTLPNESTQQSLIGTPNNMGERKSHIGKHVESVKITSKTFQQSKNSRTRTESSLDEKEILLSARSSTRSYLTRIQRTANHSPAVSERRPPVQFQESNCKTNSRTGLRSSKNNFVVESTLLKTRTRNQEGSKRNFMRENTAITLTTTNMMKNLAKVRGLSDNYNISQSTPATPNIENKQLLGISSRELWSSGKTQSNSSVNRSNSQYNECSLSRRSLTLTRVTLKAASQENNQSSSNKQLLNSTSKEMNVCHSADVKNVVHQNDSVMKQNPFITRNGVVSGKHPTTQKGKQLSFMKATSLSSAKGKSGLTQKPEPEVQRVHIKASRISPSRTRMVTSTHRKQMK